MIHILWMNYICTLGQPRTGLGPGEKILASPFCPSKGKLAENVYINYRKADSHLQSDLGLV